MPFYKLVTDDDTERDAAYFAERPMVPSTFLVSGDAVWRVLEVRPSDEMRWEATLRVELVRRFHPRLARRRSR